MSLTSTKAMKSAKGFTIVELLIVIVVIGILAAIVIVAFNGIQQRANTTGASTAGESLVKKLDAFNAENGTYPVSAGAITLAGTYNGIVTRTTSSWFSTDGTAFDTQAGAFPASAPIADNKINVYYVPASTTWGSNTGGCVYYWDYTTTATYATTLWKSHKVGATTACAAGTITAIAV